MTFNRLKLEDDSNRPAIRATVKTEKPGERNRAGAESHDRERHRRPGQMEVLPAARVDKLNNRRHAKETERRVAGQKPEGEQDRQRDLGRARQRGDKIRRRERDFRAEEMEPVFVGEQGLRAEREGEPTVPAG